ncbi:IclR family transcriptional regulator [Candidatus Phyllobacterium onerii]|uniref:IclR family transcriptional regulator n=1 Tax=Candidatus Phyllobacterium onerii TaxID=3020828 RepID=UPI002330BAC3|nr:IclR family transcriptional regulator C-terminal domain-containing protein [Phyllobacterium sp. IY22]
MKEAGRHIAAVSAALEVLAAFDRDVPVRLKDLFERTGQNRSRLLRVLGTLEGYGFIRSNVEVGTYELGSTIFRLGGLVHNPFSRMEEKIRPVLKRLVFQTSDTAFFSRIEGVHRIVLVAEESPDTLRFTAREGQTRPLHVGATSEVLLAHADNDTRERAFELVAANDRAALTEDLAAIAKRGFAVSHGEVTPHGFEISVPVRGPAGQIDAMSIAGVLS